MDTPAVTSTPYVDESDPDIVYRGTTSASSTKRDDVVTIGVRDLVLNNRCPIFDNDDAEKVFVSVNFLDFPLHELETPYSLAKDKPNTTYNFGFQKGTFILLSLSRAHDERHARAEYPVGDPDKQQQLAALVGPQSSGEYVLTRVKTLLDAFT